MPDPIGEIPILITGDWSGLEKDFDDASRAAEAGGKEIADSLVKGAAEGADLSDAFKGQLDALASAAGDAGKSIEDAFAGAGAGIREYSTDAQTLIDQQKTLENELASSQGTLAEIQNAFEAGAVSADVLARAEQQVADAFEAAHPSMKQAEDDAHELEGGLKALAENLIVFGEALAITEGLKEFGKEALEAYDSIQKATNSLTALTGSTARASEALEGIEQIAKTQPFSFPDLAASAQKLAAFGVDSEKLVVTLQDAANAARATGNSFDGVAAALGRVQLTGQVSGRQLVQLGLSWQNLADAMGTSIESAQALLKKGGQDAEDDLNVLLAAIEAKFGDFAKVPLSIGEQWTVLQNQLHVVFADIGEALAPIASQVIAIFRDDILPAVQEAVDWFKQLPEPMKDVAVAAGLLAAAIPAAAVALGGFGVAVAATNVALPALEGLMATAGEAALAFAPYLAGVAVAVAGIHFTGLDTELVDFYETVKNSLPSFAEFKAALASIGGSIATLLGPFHALGSAIADFFSGLNLGRNIIDAAFAPFALLRDTLKDAAAALEYLSGNYKSMSDAAAAGLKTMQSYNDAATLSIRDVNEELGRTPAAAKSYGEAAADGAKKASAAYAELLKAQKEANAEDEKLEKALVDAGQVAPKFDKWTADLVTLSVALNQGKISADTFAASMAVLNSKIGADAFSGLTEIRDGLNSLAPPVERLNEQIRAFGIGLDPLVGDTQRAKEGIAAMGAAFSDSVADVTKLMEANKFFNITAGESTRAIDMMNVELGSSETSLADAEVVWSKMSGVLSKLAQTDLPLAIQGYQGLIDKLTELGAPEGQILAIQQARLQAEINLAKQSGTDATDEIIALEQIRQEQQILIDQTTTLGQAYVSVRKTFNDAFDALEKGLADSIVNSKSLGQVFVNVGKQIATSILETVIKGALKPLQDELNKTGGLFDTLAKQIAGVSGLGSSAAAAASPVQVPGEAGSIPGAGGVGGGSGGAGGGGGSTGAGGSSGAGTLASLSNIANIAGAVAAIGSGIANGLQMAHLISTAGLIEVNTRQNQISLHLFTPYIEQYLPELDHLADIWGAILEQSQILRDIAADAHRIAYSGTGVGGTGSGDDGGPTPLDSETYALKDKTLVDLANQDQIVQQSADTIASFNSVAQSMADYGGTVAQSFSDIVPTLSDATDSLLALNDAIQEVHGSLPSASFPSDLASLIKSVQTDIYPVESNNSSFQQTGGSPLGSQQYQDWLRSLDTGQTFGNPGFAQANGAILNPDQVPNITGGNGQGRDLSVNITATDNSAREIAKSVTKGLQEIGVYSRIK